MFKRKPIKEEFSVIFARRIVDFQRKIAYASKQGFEPYSPMHVCPDEKGGKESLFSMMMVKRHHLPMMPLELTAENGAKIVCIGEFKQTIEVPNPEYCGCAECVECKELTGLQEYIDMKVTIEWDTIKDIYKRLTEHFLTVYEE